MKFFEHRAAPYVQFNRLRRFGRLARVPYLLFLLGVRCPNLFFALKRMDCQEHWRMVSS
jgi:hypothetical protein